MSKAEKFTEKWLEPVNEANPEDQEKIIQKAVEDLQREFDKEIDEEIKIMSRRIVVIDFDGTIVEHEWPRIGEPLDGAFEVMKELKAADWVLILWTCRENDGHDINRQFLKDAVDFCKENGVEFDGINETPMEFEFRPEETLRRKVYGHYYVDDCNLGGFPGWHVVREVLLEGKETDWRTVDLDDPRIRTT